MDKYQDLSDLVADRERWRSQDRGVVFTNGCFDLLHGGHIHLLDYAKSQGSILVVAVNDDASIRRLKGPDRPIFPLKERLEILAALSSVDRLVAFSEDTPLSLISRLLPDVLVKGGDWKPEDVVGRAEVEASGGRVKIVPYLPGHSSSEIISKIVSLANSHMPKA